MQGIGHLFQNDRIIAAYRAKALSRLAALAGPLEDAHLFREPSTQSVALRLEIVSRLEVEPKLVARSKIPSEPQGGIRADRALSMDDLVDAPRWNADILSEP
jgi:hypothetical protein